MNRDADFHRLSLKAFETCPSGSIDEVVIEKTTEGVVIPVKFPWSDVGSWAALWEVLPQDDDKNVAIGMVWG